VFNSTDTEDGPPTGLGAINSFYSFRFYNGSSEQIKVIADTAATVYDVNPGSGSTAIFNKSTGSGSSTFKSIGNTLFWGDGVDQKKWLTSPPWKATTAYITGSFIVDPNNNVQEAIAPQGVWAISTAYTVGQYIFDDNGNIQQVSTAGTSGTSQPPWASTVGDFTIDGTGTLVWTCMGDSGTSGATLPAWSSTYGTTVSDGTVNWICVGNAVQNWGTAYPTVAPANQPSAYVGADCRYWAPNTTVAPGYAILDANGNVQLMSSTAPVGGTSYLPTSYTISTGSPYQNPTAAYDGDPNSAAYFFGSYTDHIGATCTWNFSTTGSAVPPILRLNVLSEIPATGEILAGGYFVYAHSGNHTSSNPSVPQLGGSASQAGISYSTDGGATWTVVYDLYATARTKQWDTITLPSGTNINNVQVQANVWSQDVMVHLVYEINLVCEEDVTLSSTALQTGSSIPKWSTTLYGVTNDGNAYWINSGTISSWVSNSLYTFTGPTASIVDTNGNLQVLQNTGTSSTTAPIWALTPGSTTTDGTLTWLNCGSGTVAAYSGWTYVYAYHCVDGHVSTASPASYSTGPVMGNIDVPLSGLGSADPQVDATWLFRTVDGGSTFLFMESIPNASSWSLKDTNPDATLNLFIQAAIDDANDPPPVGSVAPEYHLGRVWVAVGNSIYYSQSYTSVGVAVQSFPPLNYFIFPSIVTRMVSTPSGLLVFTVSDVFVILGTGIDSVFFVTNFIDGVGLLSYFALAINGSTPMLLTSDGQFLAITTDGGVSELGFPIGDLLEKFNPASAYISWHVDGSQDKAIYVSDGATGWYRCNPTSTPETGLVWSPFAAITGGCSAVQSIEVSPGVHRLLVGGTTTVTTTTSSQTVYAYPTSVTSGQNATPACLLSTGVSLGAPGTGSITFPTAASEDYFITFIRWTGFSASLPEGATVTSIYGVVDASFVNGSTSGYGNYADAWFGTFFGSPTDTTYEEEGSWYFPPDIQANYPWQNGYPFTPQTTMVSLGTDLSVVSNAFVRVLGAVTSLPTELQVSAISIQVNYTASTSVTVNTPILMRDPTVFTDNGTAYEANAVFGSIVLAYPGQLAEVVFLTYDSPKIAGANLPSLGVILDEALPYYTGDFTTLNSVVNDPPLLPESSSLSSKRAYMSQSQLPAWCRSLQIKVDFGQDAYPEELLSLCIFGGHSSE